jgi:hypothetical protein
MKQYIRKIIGVFALTTLLYSCDTTNESGYEPSVYTSPTAFTLVEEAATATDNSFVVTYSPTTKGEGYYAVVQSGSAAPSSTAVHSGTGFMQAGNFDVDGTTPVNITVDTDIYGAYTYDVYAIHKSVDNFISETVTKLSVTTPDTMDPTFLGEESSPEFTSAEINPFAPVTFTFSEPVIYQGGDITFTGFNSERVIVVNEASALSASGTSVTVNTHGTFAEDDFIIVTWAEGTFKDNAGKNVAAVSGIDHYFSTRLFSAPEAASLLVGTYNYSTTFYGGNIETFYTPNAALFLPSSGEFELELDPSDATGTTLLGINVFAPLVNFGFPKTAANIKIKVGTGGLLDLLETNQDSGIPLTANEEDLDVEWRAWVSGLEALPGVYDLNAGTINQQLSLVSSESSTVIDDIDYNYTRVGTYAKSTPALQKSLKERNELHKTYKNLNYKLVPLNK